MENAVTRRNHLERSLPRATLVVAHPDDEVLFFSSILSRVERVIVCLPEDEQRTEQTRARRRVAAAYPRGGVDLLALETPGATPFQVLDTETEFGVEIRDARARARYERASLLVRAELSERLSGSRVVFTHNPWGEYGHADHVLVHRAVSSVAAQHGFEIWCPNYVSARSLRPAILRIARRDFGPPVELRTDIELANRVKQLYVQESCWTVAAGFDWPRAEWFNRFDASRDAPGVGEPFPLHVLHWWGGWERPGGALHRTRRRLRRLLIRAGLLRR